jgi:uncharacterized protein YjbI with pentapeptide repeats
MNVIDRLRRWEGIVFGFVIGVVATFVGSMAYNEINGFLHVSHWKRALHNRQLDEIAALMEEELEIAAAAMKDEIPLDLSTYLATQYMAKLYAHQMDYSMNLLRNNQIVEFNALRQNTPFLTLNLSQRDFSGLDLRSADFTGAELTGADFSGCDLEGASFWLAEMPRVNLTDANITRTSFAEAILSSAILTRIHGEEPGFEEAVLVDASMTQLDNLKMANFAAAELAQANLFDSSFPEARFDRADFTMASAVGSDFGEVESMNDVNLTGANLTGARIEPGRLERAWFVNADGLSSNVANDLRRFGGVARPEEVLQKVDPRIVAGFRAQIEEDESIRVEDREAVLLNMLQEYYLR